MGGGSKQQETHNVELKQAVADLAGPDSPRLVSPSARNRTSSSKTLCTSPKPPSAGRVCCRGDGPLSQDVLKRLYRETPDELFKPYVKSLVLGLIRLPDEDSVDQIPKAVVNVLGGLDQSEYEGDVIAWMKKSENRAAVVIQFAKGRPDFYPIRPKDLIVYEEQADAKWKASPVAKALEEWIGAQDLDPSVLNSVKGNMKTVAQPFVSASALGIPLAEEFAIIPPWSDKDRQIKPANQDCWLTMNAEKGIYMANDDGTDNPANYVQSSDAWTGSVPKP